MADNDRPSWSDTLSGEDLDPLTAELATFTAALDHLDDLLTRFERESDKPPPMSGAAHACESP